MCSKLIGGTKRLHGRRGAHLGDAGDGPVAHLGEDGRREQNAEAVDVEEGVGRSPAPLPKREQRGNPVWVGGKPLFNDVVKRVAFHFETQSVILKKNRSVTLYRVGLKASHFFRTQIFFRNAKNQSSLE